MSDGSEPDLVAAVVERGGERVVEVVGEVDLVTVAHVERAIEQLAGEGARRIVVDLAKVGFLDSSGVTALIRASRGDRELVLRAPSPPVLEVLEMAGLTDMLPIET